MALIKRATTQDVQFELLRSGDRVKTAGALPAVQAILDSIEPDPRYTYALCLAMGYSEFYGSNSNADWYGYCPELDFNGLLHAWPDIGQNFETDRMKGRDWPYGYPCFYNAAVYAHHRNQCPVQLGFGDVRYVFANPEMKRIELVMRIHNEEAKKKGHLNIVERILAGERCDVSMGAKIPWDLCVAPDTLVRTPSGQVPAKSISVGDKLWTHRGRYRKVQRVFRRQSTEDVRKIVTVGTPALTLSDAHPLYVVRADQLRSCKGSVNGKKRRHTSGTDRSSCGFCGEALSVCPDWVEASDVRVGDYLVVPRANPGTTEVPSELARCLGYYLGDGHRIQERLSGRSGAERVKGERTRRQGEHILTGIGFTVGHTEEAHLERLLCTLDALTPANPPRLYDEAEGRAAYKVYLHDRALAEKMVGWGGHGARGKRLSEEVYSWGREALLELLAGWVDTDGSYDANKDAVRVSTVNRGLALDMQRVALTLGFPATISSWVSNSCTWGQEPTDAYFLCLSGAALNELRGRCTKLAGSPPSASRKSQLVVLDDLVLFPVRAIERLEEPVEFVNFSVEEDESYVAEGVATHNCSICTDWDAVKRAWATFDPAAHKHPGIAVLAEHRKKPIRGLAVTRADYCTCLTTQRNKILPDGRRVFMYNIFPRFFDISCVYIGADRTARVMWFLGSSFREDPAPRPNPLSVAQSRLLDFFGAPRNKVAALEKEIPGGVIAAALHDADTAPEVRFDRLKCDPRAVLSTAAALGILLSPPEFQRLHGVPGPVFSTDNSRVDDSYAVDPEHIDAKLLGALEAMAPERSSFAPFLGKRLAVAVKVAATPESPCDPSKVKLAAAYNGYRLSVLEKSAALVETARSLRPFDPLEKQASTKDLAGLLLGLAPVVHLVASHLRRKKDEGQQLGTMADLIAENPSFVGLALLGAGIRTAMIAEQGGMLPAALKLLGTIAKK